MYVSDTLRNLSENVANGINKAGAVYIAKRYTDIIYHSRDTNETAEEIINRIKHKLGEFE